MIQVNKHENEDINCEVILERFNSKKTAEVYELAHEDILACLLFATEALENTTFMPLAVET